MEHADEASVAKYCRASERCERTNGPYKTRSSLTRNAPLLSKTKGKCNWTDERGSRRQITAERQDKKRYLRKRWMIGWVIRWVMRWVMGEE